MPFAFLRCFVLLSSVLTGGIGLFLSMCMGPKESVLTVKAPE